MLQASDPIYKAQNEKYLEDLQKERGRAESKTLRSSKKYKQHDFSEYFQGLLQRKRKNNKMQLHQNMQESHRSNKIGK